MSIVNAQANAKKKKEEEEQQKQQQQNKVVGQQQKTQQNSSKPTGTTSIPKDNQGTSRTQKSAASSLRKENNVTTTASTPRKEESKQNIVRRNTITANRSEQQQNNQQTTQRRNEERRSYQTNNNNQLPSPSMLPKANSTTNTTNNIPTSVISQYADKYGVSYDEAKAKFEKAQNMANQTLTKQGQINEDKTAQAKAERAEELRKANQKQQTPYDSFTANMAKTLIDPVNLLPFAAGKLTGNNWDLVGDKLREEERQATEQHPVASAAGDIAGFLLGNKILRGGSANSAAASAGDVGKAAYEDAILNSATKGQALANGLSNAARTTGLNAVKEFAKTDLPLDTLPYVMNSIIEGKSNKEIARDAALNVGANVGFNAIGDVLSAANALRKAGKNIPNGAEQVIEQAAKEEPEVVEQAVRNAVPEMDEAETLIRPNINNALGASGASQLKDVELANLARQGGANDPMEQAYADLLEAVDGQSIDEAKRVAGIYSDVAKQNNVQGVDDILNRLNGYVENGLPNISENLGDSVGYNVKQISDELNKLDQIGVPPTKLGNDWLSEAHNALTDYQNAVTNGGDVMAARNNLDRILGNLNKQATKLDNYDGAFSKYKGMGTPRGDLYINSDQFPKQLSPEDQAFWDSQMDEWTEMANRNRYAVPANQADNAIPSANDLQAAQNANEVIQNAARNTDNGIPNAENLAKANVESGNFLDDFARQQGIEPAEQVLKNADNSNVSVNQTANELPENMAISKGRTNVFERSGIDEAESKNIYNPDDYKYVKETNEGQLNEATSWLNELGDDAVPHYIEKDFTKDKATIRDVDSMMMLTEKLRNAARETTDATEKARLYAQSKDLSIKSVQAASQFGKDLQSWSKWADTPERVMDKGYGVMLDRAEQFLKSNPKAKWGISDVSNDIEKLFNEKNVAEVMNSGDQKAIAALKRDISNSIDEIIKGADKQTRKALQGLSEADIDQLMFENSQKSINQALEMFAGTGSMGLKDSTIDNIFELMAKNETLDPNSKAFVKNEKQIYSMIANDISKGGTFGQKLDTWRYLSMLTNPSTHLRNLTGNITMQGVAGVKNDIAAILESAADRATKGGIDRTKGLLNPFKDSSLLAATKNDAMEHAYRQLSGNRFNNMTQGIQSEVKAFKDKGLGKAVNKISDINSGALSAEDEFFKVNEYSTALAGYLKGNGFDESILDDGLSIENQRKLQQIFGKGQRARSGIDSVEGMKEQFLEDARNYAINRANVQTFNNTNEIASKFGQLTKGYRESDNKAAKALGYAFDVTIPFKNVPANVLNTAIAYSPAEWVKVLGDTNKLIKGSMKPAEYIDEIATATTGTLGMLLGGYLAHEGILQMGSGKGKREKAYDKSTDKLNNAINIGGHSVDLTQLIPSAAPLIYGATVYDVLADKTNGLSAIDTMTSGLSALADGVTDMTMLSGIADLFEQNKYKDGSTWGNLTTKVAENALNQLVPTVGGKIEKAFDNTQRNSWYTGKEGLKDTIESTAMYNLSKLPGAQQLGEKLQGSDNETLKNLGGLMALPARINSKGEAMENKGGNIIGRAANQILPLEMGNDISNETDNKLRDLAKELPAGDERDEIFPYAKQSEAKFNNADGEQVQLDPKQWQEYQQAKGQMTTEMLDKFLNSDAYEAMDNATRADTIKKMYDFAEKYNQNKIGNGAMSKDTAELAAAYDANGMDNVLSYLYGKGVAEAAGVKGNSAAAKDISQAMADGNVEEAQAKAEIAGQLAERGLTRKEAYEGFNKASTIIPGLTVDDYANTYNTINKDGNTSITQEEVLNYLNDNKVKSASEAQKIADAYGKDTWTKAPSLIDGKWKFEKSAEQKAKVEKAKAEKEASTGNSTLDARLKAKEKMREDAKNSNPPSAEDLPEAESAEEPASDGLNWQLNNGYDLASTQTYQRAKAAGVSDADFNTAWWAADADGNGYMKKAEAWNYASQFPTKEEQQKWFHILYKGR